MISHLNPLVTISINSPLFPAFRNLVILKGFTAVTRNPPNNPSTFQELYRTYYRAVRNFLHSKGHQPDSAEDLAQETFLLAFKNWSHFRHESKAATWLQAIAARVSLDNLRRRLRRDDLAPMVPLEGIKEGTEQAVEHAPNRLLTETPSQEQQLLTDEINKSLLEALDQLPSEERDCLYFRYLQGLSYGEIALVTGVPESSVKDRLRTGRTKLRKVLPAFTHPRARPMVNASKTTSPSS
nr:sigma-70 family RNA polymerase sigma factor [Acanthopleuribacter pedis]